MSNSSLVEHLRKIYQIYDQIGDSNRARTYLNAVQILDNYPSQIESGFQISSIRGIGPSLVRDIDEFLSRGTTSRYEDLVSTHPQFKSSQERDQIIDMFTKIYGVGDVHARLFYDQGYRDLPSLYNSGVLNDKQKAGVYFYHDLLKRIPRTEIEQFGNLLHSAIPAFDQLPNGEYYTSWTIAGSFRRGDSDSGDIDILARIIDMQSFLNILGSEFTSSSGEKFRPIQYSLSAGQTKYMGIIKTSPQSFARRLDIRIVLPEQYYYALLYFTGSKRFNVLMRQRAIELGGSLNEYKLVDYLGREYPAESEEQIFSYLGISYLLPDQRTNNIPSLTFTQPTISTPPI